MEPKDIDEDTIRSRGQFKASEEALKKYRCYWCQPEEEQKSKKLFEIDGIVVRKSAFTKKRPLEIEYIVHTKNHINQKNLTDEERLAIFKALDRLEEGKSGGHMHRFGPDRKKHGSSGSDEHFFIMVYCPDDSGRPFAATLVKDLSPEKKKAREKRAKTFK